MTNRGRNAVLRCGLWAGLSLVAGCTFNPRNGQIMERRSDRFDYVLTYPADHPVVVDAVNRRDAFLVNPNCARTDLACLRANDEDLDISTVGILGLRPGSRPEDPPLRCDLNLLQRPADCNFFDLRLVQTVDLARRLPTTDAPTTSERPLELIVAGNSLEVARREGIYEAGTTTAQVIEDRGGNDIAVVTVKGLRIADQLWSPCGSLGIQCPEGARFFAHVRAEGRYAARRAFLFGPSGERIEVPRFDTAPFDAGAETDRCIGDRFVNEGAAAVFRDCRNASTLYARVFARQ